MPSESITVKARIIIKDIVCPSCHRPMNDNFGFASCVNEHCADQGVRFAVDYPMADVHLRPIE